MHSFVIITAAVLLFILTGFTEYCCLSVSSKYNRMETDAEQLEFLRNYMKRHKDK